MVDRFGRQVFSTGARESVQLAGAGGKQLQQAGERIKGGMEYIEVDREKKEIAQAADFVSDMGSQLTLEDNENFLTMQQQRASNPELASSEYLKGLDERYDEAIQSAPNDQAREFLQKKKETARTRYGVRGQTWEHNQGIQNQITRLNDNTNSLINQALSVNDERDVAPLIEQHMANMTLASSHMDGEQVKAAQKGGVASIYNAFLSNKIDTNPQSVIDSLDGGQYDEILQPQQKKSLLNSALSARSRELKAKAEKQEAIDITARVEGKLQGGTEIFDPNSKDDKAAVQQHWEAVNGSKGLLELKPDSVNQLGLYAQATGIIPESAEGNLTGMLNNGTPEQRSFAVNAIMGLEEVKPSVLNQFKKRDILKASMAADMLRRGDAPNKVWEKVDELTDPLNEPVQDMRKKRLPDIMSNQGLETEKQIVDLFEEEMDDRMFFFWQEPKVNKAMSDNMITDFRKQLEENYLYSGSEDVAVDEAKKWIKNNYGVNEIGGRRRIMKNPPVNYYGIEGVDNDEWMTEQLVSDVWDMLESQRTGNKILKDMEDFIVRNKEAGMPAPTKKDIMEFIENKKLSTPPLPIPSGFGEKLYLFSDKTTRREADSTGKPTYQIFHMDGEIPIPIMDGNGSPLRMQFDPSEAIEKANDEKAKEFREAKEAKKHRAEIKAIKKQESEFKRELIEAGIEMPEGIERF